MWGTISRTWAANQMYFKRYKMEITLRSAPASAEVPEGYDLLPWSHSLLNAHAQAKYSSFRDELDSQVFPCLGEQAGCRRLMSEIASREGFLPQATWLAVHYLPDGTLDFCGTVQGIRDGWGRGGIQNLGVTPPHRGCGVGAALLQHSLAGFHRSGVSCVHLEVTAKNDTAVRLYRGFGFRHVKTVYKSTETALT